MDQLAAAQQHGWTWYTMGDSQDVIEAGDRAYDFGSDDDYHYQKVLQGGIVVAYTRNDHNGNWEALLPPLGE
ncbi:MAG TPA: hypothetical protein VFU78_22645 [Thermomicrobiales bacterium]|nr:hypothetical protein [Thermomicrobiales bacterium]